MIEKGKKVVVNSLVLLRCRIYYKFKWSFIKIFFNFEKFENVWFLCFSVDS